MAVITTSPQPKVFIDWVKYSTFEKSVRIVAWILRFVGNIRRAMKGNIKETSHYITCTERRPAEMKIITLVQSESFAEEIDYLWNYKCKGPTLVNQLNLFHNVEDGLLHCRGRLKFATTDESAKYPILLPKHHRITQLIIERAHHYGLHYGVHYVVTVLRQFWWIPKMHQAVKSVVGKCIIYKRCQSKAYPAISPPDLPSYRVNQVDPLLLWGLIIREL